MPRLIVAPAALAGLERCRSFLGQKNRDAARRAAQTIARHFNLLTHMPNMGRPLDAHPDIRELLIPFGDSGYLALYRFEEGEDVIVVLAFRHMREAGY